MAVEGRSPGDSHGYRARTRGVRVLDDPRFNKGTGFTSAEREALGLDGLLPSTVTNLEEQVKRAYAHYRAQPSDLLKNLFLTGLQDRNEVLFYRLLTEHLREMMPIVHDPVVGEAIRCYSHDYRRPRGVYLSIAAPDRIERAFTNFGFGADDVDLILSTDAEEIPGMGDRGVDGIQIAVGKLAVYTAAAGIDPARTIAVSLDVGTDNEELRNEPRYVGNRHSRVRGRRYDDFITAYVNTATKMFPKALLHWADFGPDNGRRILDRYRDRIRTFNDDVQGTGAVVLAATLNAIQVTGTALRDQRIVIFGAGTAGIGIADQLRAAMVRDGANRDCAVRQIWCVDRQGLLVDDLPALPDHQAPYARSAAEVARWRYHGDPAGIGLREVVAQVRPTILIGTSASHGAFTEEVVREMARQVPRPIIFPLSNPPEKIEAMPDQLLTWTGGQALITTGSPLPPVTYDGITHSIGQANTALLYPGLGLGTIVARATRVSDGMLAAAARAVAGLVAVDLPGASLLPQVEDLRTVSETVAVAVARCAAEEGLAQRKLTDPVQQVRAAMWQPVYRPLPEV